MEQSYEDIMNLKQQIAAKAWSDDEFRAKLTENAKAALEGEGWKLPESMVISVVEDTITTMYIVLPPKAQTSDELTDAELESVAGGGWRKPCVGCYTPCDCVAHLV